MPKIPFSVSVYEHAAALIGRTPWEASRDPEVLFEAHRTAYARYRHFPVVVGIDIYNLEPEAYGCVIEEPDGIGIPAATRHPCADLAAVRELDPLDPATAGRIPMMIDVGRRLKAEFPEAQVCLPVSGPFSILLNLIGMERLMLDVGLDPDGARAALESLIPGQVAFARAVVEAGLGVAFFESGAAPPLLSPALFREVELPPLKAILARVSEVAGRALPCIIGGDTHAIIPEMMETGTGFVICPAETDRVVFVEKMKAYPDVKVRVNLAPEVVAQAPPERILAEVDAIIALAAGDPRILLGTGALPYETPPENVDLINEYVSRED